MNIQSAAASFTAQCNEEMWIGGRWLDAEYSKVFEAFDPPTTLGFSHVARCGAADVDVPLSRVSRIKHRALLVLHFDAGTGAAPVEAPTIRHLRSPRTLYGKRFKC